jgi:hypothetical protein
MMRLARPAARKRRVSTLILCVPNSLMLTI